MKLFNIYSAYFYCNSRLYGLYDYMVAEEFFFIWNTQSYDIGYIENLDVNLHENLYAIIW